MQNELVFDESDEAEQAFWVFHRKNPHVYRLFDRFTSEAIRAGRSHFGARMVWERMRWYTQVETEGDPYKLNDHLTPYYARLWMRNHPSHEGLFELRGKKAKLTDG